MIVAFCGIDGSGKSTYIYELEKYYSNLEKTVYVLDPMKNGPSIANLQEISDKMGLESLYDIGTPSLLSISYASDMLIHMNKILKKTFGNDLILSHRYDLCCRVYSELSGADSLAVKKICKSIPVADLIVYFDVDPDVAFGRLIARGGKMTTKESIANLIKARDMYDDILASIPENNKIIINNTANGLNNNLEIIINRINKSMFNLHRAQ